MANPEINVNDTAWKDILDIYLPQFVEYCLPGLHTLIAWDKAWVSLDKELHAITKEGLTGTRLVDKLIKVYLWDGQEQWVLIHVEVQSLPDKLFPERMLTYAYRIYDKYRQPVVSCAVLTDEKHDWRPSYYEVGLAGSRLRIDYLVVKLIDYVEKRASLLEANNPIADVILSQLAAIETKRKSGEERLKVKFQLTRRLYEKGYSREQVKSIYLFIDWIIGLPQPLEMAYLQEIYALEESKKMAYISTAERIGIEKGIAQGLAQGREQGLLIGESALLNRLLRRKFGAAVEGYQDKLKQADADILLLWGERVLEAKSIEEVFEAKPAN